MPYGMSSRELIQRLQNSPKPTADHIALAEKLGIPVGTLIVAITVPHFLNVQYQFGEVSDILELEFTKRLEANVRFRKCKRCGKYFIMKGNYDANYCDRIAGGGPVTVRNLLPLGITRKEYQITRPFLFTTNTTSDMPPESGSSRLKRMPSRTENRKHKKSLLCDYRGNFVYSIKIVSILL